jgi:hypothetical protein
MRRGRADDEQMGTSPDKDYIDAKSEAISASVFGEIKAFRAEVNARFAEVNGRFAEVNGRFTEVNARLDVHEQLLRFGLKSLQDDFNTKFAQLEATFRRAHNDMLKWVLGAILAGLGLSLSVSTLLLTTSTPKVASVTPVVVVPSAAAPAPAPAPTASRQQPPVPPR